MIYVLEFSFLGGASWNIRLSIAPIQTACKSTRINGSFEEQLQFSNISISEKVPRRIFERKQTTPTNSSASVARSANLMEWKRGSPSIAIRSRWWRRRCSHGRHSCHLSSTPSAPLLPKMANSKNRRRPSDRPRSISNHFVNRAAKFKPAKTTYPQSPPFPRLVFF